MQLRDFFPLPGIEKLVGELTSSPAGVILVAGADGRAFASSSVQSRGSGRSAIFRILLEELIAALDPAPVIIVSSDPDLYHVPWKQRGRLVVSRVEEPLTYETLVLHALRRKPALLVVDRLEPAVVPLVLSAPAQGVKVLAQVETYLRGKSLLRYYQEAGVALELVQNIDWVLALQRLETVCPACKQPVTLTGSQRAWLSEFVSRHDLRLHLANGSTAPLPVVDFLHDQVFYRASGCPACQGSGRAGDVAILDICPNGPNQSPGEKSASLKITAEDCALFYALRGQVALEDLDLLAENQLYQVNRLLEASELARREVEQTVDRLRAELQAANRVLQQRTQALFSLEEFSQAMIGSQALRELALKVCRRACEVSGADKTVLYYQQSSSEFVLLAEVGWENHPSLASLESQSVVLPDRPLTPSPYLRRPPGILPAPDPSQEPALKAGLYVPLVAQDRLVGLMIVNSTGKSRFVPGQVALLQTFANQTALALQRAGLVDQLQTKVTQLEAAQVGLAQKERFERELELARQVQQSMLPTDFPSIPGFAFGARYEAARQVGGDFYDVFALDATHFGLVVADVSDKGLPAALYMALTRSLIQAEARRDLSPAAVLTSVNHLLLGLGEQNMFVTVFYGVMETASRRLTYARAGHDRPFYLRPAQPGFTVDLGGYGLPLGLLEDESFSLTEEQTWLDPGDRLVLYTDGMVDVSGPDHQALGRDALIDLFLQGVAAPIEQLCQEIFETLHRLQGAEDQFDDMTLLVVEVLFTHNL